MRGFYVKVIPCVRPTLCYPLHPPILPASPCLRLLCTIAQRTSILFLCDLLPLHFVYFFLHSYRRSRMTTTNPQKNINNPNVRIWHIAPIYCVDIHASQNIRIQHNPLGCLLFLHPPLTFTPLHSKHSHCVTCSNHTRNTVKENPS